jgi:hypothetical protein
LPVNPPANEAQVGKPAAAGRGEKIVIEVTNANATAASIDWRIQLLDDMTFAPHCAASDVTHPCGRHFIRKIKIHAIK